MYSLKAPVEGCPNLFVRIFAPPTTIKYILYYNQYQVLIIPKHALESLYLLSFNKRSNQSHSVSTIANDRSRDLRLEQMENFSCEIPFSGYWYS